MAFGKVYLVGAGCGDPELITVKARRLLRSCDVVLYDSLIHPNLLNDVPDHAEKVSVGKRKGSHSSKQVEINQLLIAFAQQGKKVVRLKGGDPTIFGRVGEEMAALKGAGISYEVVPGVSSAVAGPIYAGFPLTHRQVSRSVAFMTGSLEHDHDYAAFRFPVADTLVIMMGLSRLEHIVPRLLELDRYSLETPVMIISNATLSNQRTCTSTLGTVLLDATAKAMPLPALVVVGNVVSLAETLACPNALPLLGRRLVVLRPKQQGSELVSELMSLGAEVVQYPLLEIEPNESAKLCLTAEYVSEYSDVVFTSPNGVTQFFNGLYRHGADARVLQGKHVTVIGPKTAQVLRAHGVIADVVAQNHVAEGVVDDFPEMLHGRRILWPTSSKARDVITLELEKRGAEVTKLEVYSPVSPEGNSQIIRHGDGVIFTSSSTVDHFKARHDLEHVVSFCLGSVTRGALEAHGAGRVVQAKVPTMTSLVEAIQAYYSEE